MLYHCVTWEAYSGILFDHKKEWRTDAYDSVDEPSKHDTQWKEPDTIGHILQDPFMWDVHCGQICKDKKQIG